MRRHSRPTGARSCENAPCESTSLTSDRRFRIAALQLDDLRECYNRSEVDNALNSIPDTIEDMYRRKLEHVKSHRSRLAHIFYWVSYSIDQLTPDQIAAAPGVDLPGSRVLDVCPSGLIRLEKKQADKKESEIEIIAFDHPSVRRFLHSKELEQGQLSIFFLSERKIHSEITKLLLDYLLHLDQSQLSPSVMHTKPFLQYAASNWYEHLKRSGVVLREDSEIQNKIMSLFGEPMSPAFLNWMRVANPEAKAQNFDLSEDDCPSPLYIAVYMGRMVLAEDLIDRRSYINACGGEFGTVLQLACYRGFLDIVKSLISQGASVNIQAGVFGTALQAASAAGHADIVGVLLDKDADPNSMSGALGSPVQAALTGDYSQIVQMLTARGAKLDRKSDLVWGDALKHLDSQSEKYQVLDSPLISMLGRKFRSKSLAGLRSRQKILFGLIRLWKTPRSELVTLLYSRDSEKSGKLGTQIHKEIHLISKRGMEAIDSEYYLYRSCFWALLLACTLKVSQPQALLANANSLSRFTYRRQRNLKPTFQAMMRSMPP